MRRRGDYTRAVYTRPLRLKSEAVNASKSFRVAAENQSGSKITRGDDQQRARGVNGSGARYLRAGRY